MTKAINLSNLERYNNKLKPLVLTDAEVVNNDLQLKYLDNETKTLELPKAPKAVSDAEISNNEIQLTFTDSDTKTLELPTVTAVSDAEISGNDLQLTFTDSDTKTLELPASPKAVADAEISGNNLQLTYTDSETKTLALPGDSFPVRTVTRIPTYIEIHFQLGDNDDNQIDEKLDIPLSMAKDIIKFYARDNNIFSPLGKIQVTDVTETQKNNQYDTVYLAAVNCNPKERYDLSYEAYVVLETSFGDFNLQTAPLMESIEESASQAGETVPTYPETIPAQVTEHSEAELFQTAGSGYGGNSGANYYIFRAVLEVGSFHKGDNADWSNQNISINGNRASVHFDLIFEDAKFENIPVTFTETVIE